MKERLKQIIKLSPLYYPLRNWANRRRQVKELVEWESKGRPVPPPHIIKQRILEDYARERGLTILVETGTYHGDMVDALKHVFDKIYSIELSRDLYENARKRFKAHTHIELIHGDSGQELLNVMSRIDRPALFWLDGHYSAGSTARASMDTPIYEELRHIFESPDRGHVIVIDDARCFGPDPAYPRLEELCAFIRSRRSNVDIVVEDDSIRIAPTR